MNIPSVFAMSVAGLALFLIVGCQTPPDAAPSDDSGAVRQENSYSNTFQRVWFTESNGTQLLTIRKHHESKPVTRALKGDLAFILYPIGEPVRLYHLVDNASGRVTSTDDAEAFIDELRTHDGKVDYYVTCVCGPGIGSYLRFPGSGGSVRILSFMHRTGRAGQYYMIGCCFGVGRPRAREWPQSTLDGLDLTSPRAGTDANRALHGSTESAEDVTSGAP